MSDQITASPPSDPLDELVNELLLCGGVLSQIVSHMVASERSGRSSPDAAPIPEVARFLIRSVIGDAGKRYSKRDIKVACRLVGDVTHAICEEIFFVGPDETEEEPQQNGAHDSEI